MDEKINAIDSVWTRREAEKAVRIMERLMSHTAFIEQARESKANRGASLALEHEVILQARDAEHDARELAAITLGLAAHFNNAGVLEEALGEWTRRLDRQESTEAKDFWAKAADDLQLPNRLREAGVPDSLIQWLEDRLGRATFTFGVNDQGEPTVRSDDRRFEVTITAPTQPGGPTSLGDLLFARRLDATIAALLDPTRVVAPVFPARITEDGKSRIMLLDGVLAGSVFYLQEFTHRRRQFEDVGLPMIEGHFLDPLTGLIAGAIAVGVGALFVALCVGLEERGLCVAAEVLFALGFILIVTAAGEAVGAAAAGLKAQTMDWWELRAGDIPVYQDVVQGGF